MSNEPIIAVAAVIDQPFTVIDAALGEFFLNYLTENARWRWSRRTGGSSVHRLTTKDGTELFHIIARSMASNETSLVLGGVAESLTMPEFGNAILSQFWAWLCQDQANRANVPHLQPPQPGGINPAAVIAQATKLEKPRGRKSKEEDDWAWKQVNEHGRPKSMVRKEWQQLLTRELIDPERSFRHAINPDRRRRKK
jgi:hypothetical protein